MKNALNIAFKYSVMCFIDPASDQASGAFLSTSSCKPINTTGCTTACVWRSSFGSTGALRSGGNPELPCHVPLPAGPLIS
jgi:hypothetical protein